MNAPLRKDELLAVMLAPARHSPERSRALPAACYRDPAESVKLEAEKPKPKPKKPKPPKVNKKWR
ncbi:hypothetical protein GJ698_02240 [Pseudoduganella sp. FT26W]|uniref:Uncharacterized protein n=1 Tax=Duganella aquatilis TaxID=2666082 RepID=A0A844D6S8_9BURK|nr:hypothetical protein [Duganella aquatilis]MRW82909.1 hypothetical protein [Duganella aquatilis]